MVYDIRSRSFLLIDMYITVIGRRGIVWQSEVRAKLLEGCRTMAKLGWKNRTVERVTLKITRNAWKYPWNLLFPVLPGVDENGHAVSPGYFMTQISCRHVGIPLFLFRLSRRTAFSPSPPPPPPRPALKIPSVSLIETSCVSGAIKRCCSFAVRPRGKYIGSAADKQQDRETVVSVVSVGSSLTE